MKVLTVEFAKSQAINKINQFVTILHRNKKDYKFAISFPEYNCETLGNIIIVFYEDNQFLNDRIFRFLNREAEEFSNKDISKYKIDENSSFRFKKVNTMKKATNGYVNRLIKHYEKTKKEPESFFNKFIIDLYVKGKNVDEIVNKLKDEINENRSYPFLKIESKSLRENRIEIPTAVLDIRKDVINYTQKLINLDEFNSYGLAKSDDGIIPNIVF